MKIVQIVSVGRTLNGLAVILALDEEGDLWQAKYCPEESITAVSWQFLGSQPA